jgi:hypothetical protein
MDFGETTCLVSLLACKTIANDFQVKRYIYSIVGVSGEIFGADGRVSFIPCYAKKNGRGEG